MEETESPRPVAENRNVGEARIKGASARDASASEVADTNGICPLDTAAPVNTRQERVGGGWYETADFSRAERRQAETLAPLLVYFRTDWCPYCRALERELLPESEVEGFLSDRFVRCRLNPEVGPDAASVAIRYGVTGYPDLEVSVAGLPPVHVSPYDHTTSEKRYLAPADFVARLERVVAGLAQDLVVAGYDARQRFDLGESVRLLDRAVALDGRNFEAFFHRAVSRAELGDTRGAYSDLRRAAELDSAQIGVYREAQRLLAGENRWADAAACWSRFLADQPGNREAEQQRANDLTRTTTPDETHGN